jgi:DNA-binding Lrp family transcriptional regulator
MIRCFGLEDEGGPLYQVSINKFARRFRRIVQASPRVLSILEAMMRVRRPSISDIAKLAGVSSSTVSRTITKLESEGLHLRGLVNDDVVGLEQAIHIFSSLEGEGFPRPDLLRWVVEGVIPLVSIANTLLPKGEEEQVIREIESSFPTCETIKITRWLPPRHNIKKWFRPVATTFIVRWDELLNDVDKVDDDWAEQASKRYDPLDVLILSVLEKKPFAKGAEIREVLEREHGVSVRYQRIMVHLRKRIYRNAGYMGAALATTPLEADRSLTAVLMLMGPGAERLARAVLTHPFFYDAYVGEVFRRVSDRRVIVRSHIPVTELTNLVKFLFRAGETGYLSKWRIIIAERVRERAAVPDVKAVISSSKKGSY